MFRLIAVLALASGALARDQFIVGGTVQNIADFPWQGSYRSASGSHTCGCVFIGGKYVLTAAHCGGTSDYSMAFGNTNREAGTKFSVSSVVQNPEYGNGPGFSPNDIAVVTSTEEITGNDISPATMAADANNPGGTAYITGWGRTCGGCSLPTDLQGVEIPIIDDDLCEAMHGNSFQSGNMICVWDEANQDKGACNGDSGGPMTQGSTLYGLTSWGRSGCSTAFPSVYNRVGAFKDWVCGETEGVPGC